MSTLFLANANFSDTLSAAKMGRWIWHLQSDLLIADARMQTLLGIATPCQSLRIEGFSHYISREDLPQVERLLGRCWREGRELATTFGVAYGDGGESPEGPLLRWRGSRLRQPKYPLSTIGGCAFPATPASKEHTGSAARLSEREHAIARLAALGHSNKQISDILGVNAKTISASKRRVADKLGIYEGQPGWVQYALECGWFLQ